ncbi:MAG: RimK/LysX family protein [Aliarcobacter sp.]
MKVILFVLVTLNLYSNEILGEIDKFNLPSLNLTNINARIDTGATTSSIHCTNIIKIDNQVKCKLLNKSEILKPILKTIEVKSSNGEKNTRYFIKGDIEIFNKIYEIELSLNDRTNMKYPLLIGRELLKKGFIVDVQKQNLSYVSSNYKE